MISQVMDEKLELIAVEVIEKSSRTFSNVLARGRAEGAASMDAQSAKYIRRQIWTESIIQAVVQQVRKMNSAGVEEKSKDGFLFAIPQTLRRMIQGTDEGEDSRKFDDAVNQIPPSVMASVMSGKGKISNFFFQFSTADWESVWTEMIRLDAVGRFDGGMCWVSIDKPPICLNPALELICRKISYIPFELNMKNSSLKLQVIQFFQFSIFRDNDMGPGVARGGRYACIVPILQKADDEILGICDKEEIRMHRGDLLLVDTERICYSIKTSDSKQFVLSAFISGPSTIQKNVYKFFILISSSSSIP